MPRRDRVLTIPIEVEGKSVEAKRPGTPVDLKFLMSASVYQVQMRDPLWHPHSSSQERKVNNEREERRTKGEGGGAKLP